MLASLLLLLSVMKFLILSLTMLAINYASPTDGLNVSRASSPTSRSLHILIHQGLRRGGNTHTYAAANVNQYDTNSDDEDDDSEAAEVDLVTSRFADIAAQNAKKMSNFAMDEQSRKQQSKSYFLSAALWCSLALDVVLNRTKRSMLIPGAAEVGGRLAINNLAVTSSLVSGYLLSAGLSFFLSKDLSRDDTTWDEELKIEPMRKQLHVLLLSFGLVNLCANINPASAPFLGLGGFVINSHNALIGLNGWLKESSSSSSLKGGSNHDSSMKDLLKTVASLPRGLFRTAGVSMGFHVRMMSSLYMSCGIIAAMRGVDIITRSLVPHYMTCYAAKSVSTYIYLHDCDFIIMPQSAEPHHGQFEIGK